MVVFTVCLDDEDAQNGNRLMLYDVRDNSVEGMKRFITESYPGVVEDSIETLCLESGFVYYATFTTIDEECDKKLHWHVAASHVITI